MRDEIFNELGEIFKVRQDTTIELKELYGFTFVFKKRVIGFRDKGFSAEISPLGIIYDENGQYYFAPLHRSVNMNEVVREYVKSF